jgi:hypothetical protein
MDVRPLFPMIFGILRHSGGQDAAAREMLPQIFRRKIVDRTARLTFKCRRLNLRAPPETGLPFRKDGKIKQTAVLKLLQAFAKEQKAFRPPKKMEDIEAVNGVINITAEWHIQYGSPEIPDTRVIGSSKAKRGWGYLNPIDGKSGLMQKIGVAPIPRPGDKDMAHPVPHKYFGGLNGRATRRRTPYLSFPVKASVPIFLHRNPLSRRLLVRNNHPDLL